MRPICSFSDEDRATVFLVGSRIVQRLESGKDSERKRASRRLERSLQWHLNQVGGCDGDSQSEQVRVRRRYLAYLASSTKPQLPVLGFAVAVVQQCSGTATVTSTVTSTFALLSTTSEREPEGPSMPGMPGSYARIWVPTAPILLPPSSLALACERPLSVEAVWMLSRTVLPCKFACPWPASPSCNPPVCRMVCRMVDGTASWLLVPIRPSTGLVFASSSALPSGLGLVLSLDNCPNARVLSRISPVANGEASRTVLAAFQLHAYSTSLVAPSPCTSTPSSTNAIRQSRNSVPRDLLARTHSSFCA